MQINSSSNRFDINPYRFKLNAGANTDPPPSVPIPISFIPKNTFTAVELEEPVINLPVIGFSTFNSIALPSSDIVSTVCLSSPISFKLFIKSIEITLVFLIPT